MVGGGGGGDVKLISALSVWMGYRMTLAVIAISVVLVVVLTMAARPYGVMKRGMRKTKDDYPRPARESRRSRNRSKKQRPAGDGLRPPGLRRDLDCPGLVPPRIDRELKATEEALGRRSRREAAVQTDSQPWPDV